MRRLLILVLVAAGLWSGYWLIGARAAETAIRGWLDARAAEGWVADYDAVRVRGFPNRFDTTIEAVDLADPLSGVGWAAPFVQVMALSYRPNHVIAVWPHEQTLVLPLQEIAVRSGDMRGSVVFEAGTALRLERSSFVVDALELASDAGWQAAADELRFATRQSAARENFHDIGVQAAGLTPPAELTPALGLQAPLPATLQSLRLDLTLGFDGPLGRAAVEAGPPALTAVELNEFRLAWGDLLLRADGALEVDAAGVPEGRIVLRADNWRPLLEIAVAAGLLDAGVRPTAERALEVLAGLEEPAETLQVPLVFANGRMALGPLPLGAAPQLDLR